MTGKEEDNRWDDNHLQDRRQTDLQERDEWHCLSVLPALVGYRPDLKANREEDACGQCGEPRHRLHVGGTTGYPKQIAVYDRQCEIEDAHEQEIAPRRPEAHPEVLPEGDESFVEGGLQILPEQMQDETTGKERSKCAKPVRRSNGTHALSLAKRMKSAVKPTAINTGAKSESQLRRTG